MGGTDKQEKQSCPQKVGGEDKRRVASNLEDPQENSKESKTKYYHSEKKHRFTTIPLFLKVAVQMRRCQGPSIAESASDKLLVACMLTSLTGQLVGTLSVC